MQRRSRHDRITRINSKVGRDINRSIVLNTVRRNQPISRASLSELTRLNKSTVSSIVASLLEEDLLLESPDRGGGVGRNPVNLSVKQGRHYVGAVTLDAPVSQVAIVDIDGTIKSRDRLQIADRTPEALVSEVVKRLKALRAALGPHVFHGIGVTVGGIVDAVQSHVVYAANLGWSDVDLGSILREHIAGVDTVLVENDAKASALAELLLGNHRLTPTNLIFLALGTGIGAGVAVQGRILSGRSHAAGEVGHMTVAQSGQRCACGNIGCWEIYASERAPLLAYLRSKGMNESVEGSTTVIDVIEAALRGDMDAVNAVRTWARHVGVGIGNMVTIVDPEVVVIGGAITRAWDLVADDVRSAAHGSGVFSRQHATLILPTSLADHPPLLGAAALNIRRIFHDYSLTL